MKKIISATVLGFFALSIPLSGFAMESGRTTGTTTKMGTSTEIESNHGAVVSKVAIKKLETKKAAKRMKKAEKIEAKSMHGTSTVSR